MGNWPTAYRSASAAASGGTAGPAHFMISAFIRHLRFRAVATVGLVKVDRSAALARGADASHVALDPGSIIRIEHQAAVGQPLDVAGLCQADIARHFDG